VTFNGAGGTPSSITLTNGSGLPPTTGISGWPANSAGVLTNNGSGTLSWGAGGSGITVGTTTVTSGTATRLLYETAGNVVGEISGATSDGITSVQFAALTLLSAGEDGVVDPPSVGDFFQRQSLIFSLWIVEGLIERKCKRDEAGPYYLTKRSIELLGRLRSLTVTEVLKP
jgi:hypothetical protein